MKKIFLFILFSITITTVYNNSLAQNITNILELKSEIAKKSSDSFKNFCDKLKIKNNNDPLALISSSISGSYCDEYNSLMNKNFNNRMGNDIKEYIDNGIPGELAFSKKLIEVEIWLREQSKLNDENINRLKDMLSEVDNKIKESNTKTFDDNIGKYAGVYGFNIGDNLNNILKKCIDNNTYITIMANSIPNEFKEYINDDIQCKISPNNQIVMPIINKHKGKFLNLISSGECFDPAFELVDSLKRMVSYDYHGIEGQGFIYKVLNDYNIDCSYDELIDSFNHNFINKISENINNGWDIKQISMYINNNKIYLFFINSPTAKIDNILFFITMESPINENIEKDIKNLFKERYGIPKKIDKFYSYYNIDKNYLVMDSSQKNNYYFFNPLLIKYYIKIVSALYNKYNEIKSKKNVEGM